VAKSRIVAEDEWRAYMEGTHKSIHRMHKTLGILPADPRCRFCAVPFAGAGGWVARHLSQRNRPWEKNPSLCQRCVVGISEDEVVGAEIEMSFLFADVRASSELARRLGDRGFTEVMQRFYRVATEALWDHDALLDKFVGDAVDAFFIPFITGPDHSGRAVEAARALFRSVGYGTEVGPWLHLGAGVHSGRSFVGWVSRGLDSMFTALGDTINVTAHLASQAKAGEILVTDAAAASLDVSGLEHRHLSLKGHEIDAAVIRVEEQPAVASA
jgi:adenylate cyclase